ncbi:MAG: PQQ-dependent sugar dehydrogenase, partial [Sphingomonadaceae bacterium]
MRLAPLALTALLAACAKGTVPAAAEPPFNIRPVASFDEPWAMAFLPDGRMLVTEKKGALRVVTAQGQKSPPVAGTPRVDYGGQGGFGDIALSPDFARDGLVYLSWAEAGEGDTRGAAVGRARLVIGPGAQGGRLEGLQVIWRQVPKTTGRGHYSHRLAFSPDGRFLFIAAGDRQKITPAQDPDQLLGKIVRLTPDGRVPADNPNVGQPGVRPQWWSTGHRNILGMAFDAQGRLWFTRFGLALTQDNARGYRGGAAAQLWRWDGRGEAVRVAGDWPASILRPLPWGERLIVLADAGGNEAAAPWIAARDGAVLL